MSAETQDREEIIVKDGMLAHQQDREPVDVGGLNRIADNLDSQHDWDDAVLVRALATRLQEAEARCAALTDRLTEVQDAANDAEGEVGRLEARCERMEAAVAFFASVIKSGEAWTEACQQALDAAFDNGKE